MALLYYNILEHLDNFVAVYIDNIDSSCTYKFQVKQFASKLYFTILILMSEHLNLTKNILETELDSYVH